MIIVARHSPRQVEPSHRLATRRLRVSLQDELERQFVRIERISEIGKSINRATAPVASVITRGKHHAGGCQPTRIPSQRIFAGFESKRRCEQGRRRRAIVQNEGRPFQIERWLERRSATRSASVFR
jgi:hypothetical protein